MRSEQSFQAPTACLSVIRAHVGLGQHQKLKSHDAQGEGGGSNKDMPCGLGKGSGCNSTFKKELGGDGP